VNRSTRTEPDPTRATPSAHPALRVQADDDELPTGELEQLLQAPFGVEDLPGLQAAQRALPWFNQLRDLVRLGEANFVVRVTVLGELASSDRPRWDQEALARHFSWLDERVRTSVLRSLTRAGWLERVEAQLRLTGSGEALWAVVSRLLSIEPEMGDLALGVLNVELSRDLDVDAAPALRHLHHNLCRIVDEAEDALRSHSEVRILEARDRVDRNLAWARRARSCLEKLDLSDDASYRVAHDVGRVLSELHQWHAVLYRALGDLARRRVPLGESGLSMVDVTTFLMRCDAEQLASFGEALVSRPVAPLFAITDNLLSEAEYEWLFGTDRLERSFAQGWAEGPPDLADEGEPELPEFHDLERFSEDLAKLAGRGGEGRLASFLPRRSWAETAYRMSLLTLGESAFVEADERAAANQDALTVVEGEEVAVLATLGRQRFSLDVEGDGWQGEPIYTDSASEISRGRVRLIMTESS
jgi:hypothetical protein